MLFNLLIADNLSFFLVFVEGLISFFSPCIIPLLPVYMAYLAGNTKSEKDGKIQYERKTVFLHTLFFILGISFAFFVLLLAFTALGQFFNRNQVIFTRISGIIIIFLGLHQLGIFELEFLQKLHVPSLKRSNKMNPIVAFITGFTLSFAWTPCIGPILSSVLLMASTSSNKLTSVFLMFVYTLGFTLPFLILGLFTTHILAFFKRKQKFIQYAVKAGGVILVIMGIMTLTGWMNSISAYLNTVTNDMFYKTEKSVETSEDRGDDNTQISSENSEKNGEETSSPSTSEENKRPKIPAIDFNLKDQLGNSHTLADYEGKVIFLNFWATWCPPCRKEMPDIEKLYNEYGKNTGDVIFLGVANPWSEENTNTREVNKEGVMTFLEDNGYTFPTVFDEDGNLSYNYMINSLPTTFLIDKEGNIFGYVQGMMTESMMRRAIEDTLKASE